MNALDHVFAAVLIVGLPAYTAWKFPKTRRRLESGAPGARISVYARSIAILWAAAIALLLHWLAAGRPFPTIGLVWPATQESSARTLVLCVLVVVFFAQQIRTVSRSEAARARFAAQLEAHTVSALMPRTIAEARMWAGVSLTAGICEEVLYRSFLLWYFEAFLDRGLAAIAAVVAFGLAHAYQGRRGMLATGVIGGLAMAAYLATDSLVAPIVFHATVDLVNGHIARVALANAALPPSP